VQLTQLRNFVAIVEAGSVRAAARQLGISQPAATKGLRGLERELDTVLVQRSSRGVVLTEAGKAFFVRARTVMGELREARQELARLGGSQSEIVRIGVATVIGPWLIPPSLTSFRGECPDCTVRILEGTQDTLLPLLRQGELDFAVCLRLDAESTRGFNARALARLRLTVVGRKGHPLRSARTLHALRGAHWILSRPQGTGGVVEQAFAAAGLDAPKSGTECDSQAIRMALLASSDALALLGTPMLAERSVAAHVQEIPLDKPLPLMTFCIYSRADARLSPAARSLATAIATQARTILRAGQHGA
jgi:LysR family transcriptional regulator, regulator of abg operon